MKKLEGKITITRDSTDTINISIEDRASGLRLLECKMELEYFAKAITNLAFQPCAINYYGSLNIGKKRELKQEFVTLTDGFHSFEKEIKTLVKPYEVDGWLASSYDTDSYNHHHTTDKGYSVTFIRYVDL